MAGGRPTKLTPELAASIVLSMRAGNYVETAAAQHGIDKVTLFRWLKDGANKRRKAEEEFRNAVMKAEAEAEARSVALIAKAAGTQWQAAAWHLERKNPRKWGMRVRVHVTDELNAALDKLEREFAEEPELLARVLEALSRTDESHGPAGTEAE